MDKDSTAPAPTVRVAAVQMVSKPRVGDNLRDAETLIAQAVVAGARLVALPEYFCIMGLKDRDKVAVREDDGRGPIQEFLSAQAARHGIWLARGTAPLAAPVPDKVLNSLLVYGPDGRRAARYDKIHLFSFTHGTDTYDEARTIVAGRETVAFDCNPGGAPLRVCPLVCYDLRFPELYRRTGKPCSEQGR